MAFGVTESCIQCKYTECVNVCPMDCFMERPNFLVINPDECVDCSMCVPECPVDAIVAASDIPAEQQHFVALNRELSRRGGWKRITRSKSPLLGHDTWARVADKFGLLQVEGETD